jgi:hypothetical protein
MTEPQTDARPARLRLLRVVEVAGAVITYCLQNIGRLFVVSWFACALLSVSLMLLASLVHSEPPGLPAWALARDFEPETWLSPFVVAPWQAMAWFFILIAMSDPDSRSGIVTTPARSLTWLRFELNPTIWIAAAIIAVVELASGLTRFALHQLLLAFASTHPASDSSLALWGTLGGLSRVLLMAVIYAWCFMLAGQVLRTGTFSIARLHRTLRGNWLRVIAIFLLLGGTLLGVNQIIGLTANWIILSVSDIPTGWAWSYGIIRYGVYFPVQMLWILPWGVAIGMILNVLDDRVREPAREVPATA